MRLRCHCRSVSIDSGIISTSKALHRAIVNPVVKGSCLGRVVIKSTPSTRDGYNATRRRKGQPQSFRFKLTLYDATYPSPEGYVSVLEPTVTSPLQSVYVGLLLV